jgi:CBS domain-containing protein
MKKIRLVGDVMVRNPVVAEKWHRVDHVRREMLANSFSSLPIFIEEKWWLITDAAVMRFIRTDTDTQSKLDRKMASTIEVAITEYDGIELVEANCSLSNDQTSNVVEKFFGDRQGRNSFPVLVIEEGVNNRASRIVGILTSFDLL